jgi:hypothetical protein
VPRRDLYIPNDDVGVERIVTHDELFPIQKEKIPEPRPLQDHEVRVPVRYTVRGDKALLLARPCFTTDSSIVARMLE